MSTTFSANLISRHDYLPFGEEITAGNAGRDNYFGRQDFVKALFTGQERDPETQVNFFKTRYFSAAQGTFNSPDPMNAGADLADPQSWNGYAYVRGNPSALTDPSGMDPLVPGSPDDPGFPGCWDDLCDFPQ